MDEKLDENLARQDSPTHEGLQAFYRRALGLVLDPEQFTEMRYSKLLQARRTLDRYEKELDIPEDERTVFLEEPVPFKFTPQLFGDNNAYF